jgi:UDP-N-acetylenolpyruvoylglucosamine reductase
MTILQSLQEKLNGIVKEQEILAPYTTLKIGGPAQYFFVAQTYDDLAKAVIAARELDIPFYVLGGGSNILISDQGLSGLVIKNNAKTITIKGAKGIHSNGVIQHERVFVEADSGTSMNQLVRFTVEEGLAGLETHLGLPGSVGGAIYMNSKWMHPESYVGDCVYQATIIKPDNSIQTVPQSYFHFAYDSSIVQSSKDIVLTVVFALHSELKDELWKKANESIAYRRETQPQGIKTAGCTFRNISKAEALAKATPDHTTSAGFLIDHAGLKGVAEGDAVISDAHANFIINKGNAKASDVIKLIERAREEVKKQFGVTLVEEIVRVNC